MHCGVHRPRIHKSRKRKHVKSSYDTKASDGVFDKTAFVKFEIRNNFKEVLRREIQGLKV